MKLRNLALLKAFAFILFILSNNILFAQRVVTGIVYDNENGETLIGANIVLKEDQTVGTVTDFEGKFSISVPENISALIVSYAGFEIVEIPISTQEFYEIQLSPGIELQDVVIVGYGTVKREDLTGSIQSVSSDKFNRGAITGAQELLAGKMAGVAITTEGSPGAGSRIRIRGESSISGGASNDPLIVVDGIPLDNSGISGSRNNLNIINPNDIESMTVLKDASAAAIYGNRASAGVILITTKKSKAGSKLSINYNGNISQGTKINQVDVLSADEFRDIIKERYKNAANQAPINNLGTDNTDWQSLIYQNAIGHDHNLSVSGAVKKLPFRLSLGFVDKDGLLKTDNFNRYTGAINLNPQFLDNRLQTNFHFKAMRNKNHFADRGAIGNALSFDPTRSPYADNKKFGGYYTWTVQNGNANEIAPRNPLALLYQRDDNSTVNHYIVNGSIDYRFKFLKDLRWNLSLGHDQSMGEGRIAIQDSAAFVFNNRFNTSYNQTRKNSVLETYLNYKKTINKHNFDIMGGYSWQKFLISSFFRDSDVKDKEIISDPNDVDLFLLSLYSRLNYNFNEKYYLTFSLRRDGTSRFSPDRRWGLFPAASAAIKIIDNDNKTLNTLKLRAGIGTTGQQDIGDAYYYAYLPVYTASDSFSFYQFGNEYVSTLRPEEYDANIKWEENTTINLALDFSLVRDRVWGSVDVYRKRTKDLLNRIPVPAGTNLSNFIVTNVGNMENRGVELSLNFVPIKGWELSTNFTHNIPKVTKLTAIDDPAYIGVATGGIAGGVGSNIQIHTVNYAPSSFYVRKQAYDENGNILEGVYQDINNDGVVNGQDFYRYKSPFPKYSIGFTSNYNYKNFDFSFAGRSLIGNYVYNNVQTDMGYLARMYASNAVYWNVNQSAVDLNVEQQSSLTFSDHFVKEASFLRLDHITLGYNFSKILKGMRIYGTIQNPFVITKYDGLDPEIGNGIDNNIYPRPRTILGGLSINF